MGDDRKGNSPTSGGVRHPATTIPSHPAAVEVAQAEVELESMRTEHRSVRYSVIGGGAAIVLWWVQSDRPLSTLLLLILGLALLLLTVEAFLFGLREAERDKIRKLRAAGTSGCGDAD